MFIGVNKENKSKGKKAIDYLKTFFMYSLWSHSVFYEHFYFVCNSLAWLLAYIFTYWEKYFMFIKAAFIWLKIETKNSNIVKYYYNLK